LRVLSLAEVPNSLGLKAFGTVTLNEKLSYA
jgi:hypothetical protein